MKNWIFALFLLIISLSLSGCMTTTNPQNVGDVDASKGTKHLSLQQASQQTAAASASISSKRTVKKTAPAKSRAVATEYPRDFPSTQWFINDSKIEDYA